MESVEYKVINGTSYHAKTSMDLINVLERVRANRTRILVIYGDTETGSTKGWEPCAANRGRIGRSTGNHIPLLVKTSRSYGGEALLDDCIVQVRESPGGRILWSHPKYKEG